MTESSQVTSTRADNGQTGAMSSSHVTVERSWTITTWNVRGSRRPDPASLGEVLRLEEPDVVAIQEIRRGAAADLAAELGMDHIWALKHYPFTPLLRSAAEGMAILTPHVLSQAGHQVVSDKDSTWTYRRRIVQWAVVSRHDASGYRIYNAHLSPGDRASDRRIEAGRIAALATQHGDAPPPVIAGDLNDANDPSVIAALPGVEVMTPPFTNPAGSPTQTLDHVLVPASAGDVSVTVPGGGERWAALSDHLPVTVRFTMDWVAGDFT